MYNIKEYIYFIYICIISRILIYIYVYIYIKDLKAWRHEHLPVEVWSLSGGYVFCVMTEVLVIRCTELL